MGRLFSVALCLILLSGCTTNQQLLELKRDQLLSIERKVLATQAGIAQGSYDPEKYDLYLALDADVFDRVLAELTDQTFELEASGRQLSIVVRSVKMSFSPGNPQVKLDAYAVDRKSSVRADLLLDSRLLIEGDPTRPDTLRARIVATRMVPKLRWGVLDFTRARFVRALLELEAIRFTERLPTVGLPLKQDFGFGQAAMTVDSGEITTGNGSWIRGNISYPSTEVKGQFVVKNVLFLQNGVHLFATIEGF